MTSKPSWQVEFLLRVGRSGDSQLRSRRPARVALVGYGRRSIRSRVASDKTRPQGHLRLRGARKRRWGSAASSSGASRRGASLSQVAPAVSGVVRHLSRRGRAATFAGSKAGAGLMLPGRTWTEASEGGKVCGNAPLAGGECRKQGPFWRPKAQRGFATRSAQRMACGGGHGRTRRAWCQSIQQVAAADSSHW
jgi:hypothetical protein